MKNCNLNKVLPLGVLTGSRAFNCETKDSAWDIVILSSDVPDYEGSVKYIFTTIWGPLLEIIKYWDDDNNCINLFVYEDANGIILDKFKELNNLMNFIYGAKLKDKNQRIKAFTEIIAKVGITDMPYKS